MTSSKAQEVASPLDAEVVEASADSVGAFTMFGEEWKVLKRPPSLMFARLARIDEDDPEALGTIDEVLEHSLGKEQHKRFLRAYYNAAPADGNDGEMFQEALAGIMAVATGRPTN